MSSEIFYKRAFIKVGDGYIPMVCHGSSNCFDFNRMGKMIPEKCWHVLNCMSRNRVLYSVSEIHDIAEYYGNIAEDNRGGIRKSRYTAFSGEEFKKWIIGGMRSAHTVEEYRSCMNEIHLRFCYKGESGESVTVHSSEELLLLLSEHRSAAELDMGFLDKRSVKLPKRKGRYA